MVLLPEGTHHRTRARTTPNECEHANYTRCHGAGEGGVHLTGPRGPPQTVHTGQNAECQRKPPFCCVEQVRQDDFRWNRARCLRHLQCCVTVQHCIKVTITNVCVVMEEPPVAHLFASAEKAD